MMTSSLLGILSIFSVTFATPFASAVTPLALPLPQSVNYAFTAINQLAVAPFSTDPRATAGHVAAVTTGRPDPQVFIVNNSLCTAVDDNLSYQVIVRNYGDVPAENVTVQFQYPQGTNFRDADPKPNRELAVERLVEWFTPVLLPGGSLPAPGAYFSNAVIITVDVPPPSVTVRVTVFYNGGIVLSDHTINGTCGVPLVVPGALPASPQPAIVCDPGEIGCRSTVQDLRLKLGENYSRALTDATKGFVNCSGAGCSQPDLGPRFQEAIADIIPGDCRVIEDNIISTPQFQDALNRRADPAAKFLFPLYESGRRFRQLILENELLGITHNQQTYGVLKNIHTKHWQKQVGAITLILEGSQPTDSVRSKIQSWDDEWLQETKTAQSDIQQRYAQMQSTRRGKFDEVGQQAVMNATQSLQLACGPPPSDGGVALLLPAVKAAYETALSGRTTAFTQTQDRFISPTVYSGAKAWQQELAAALNAFDAGDKKLLENYLLLIPKYDTDGFTRAWQATYEEHYRVDAQTDNQVRLQQWEKALDVPKAAAASCEKENVFPPPVATTWCESGSKPEFIIQEAPQPARPNIRPPAPISGGETTAINPGSVSGTACGGQAGDPYWEASCRCHCGQSVQCGNIVTLCELCYPITRHDIFVTSNLECLWDGPPDGFRHKDPYF